ncbi:hypothetical protein MferCBS31731_003535 [Microsporum ferrugineum]
MSPSSFNPLPLCPNPIQWDVPGRIAELQAMIDDPATSEPQKINLQAAIDLYHRKELPGPIIVIQDGKVVPLAKLDIRRPWWGEGYGQQLSSQAMIPAAVPEPSSSPSQSVSESSLNQQLAHRMTYNRYPPGRSVGHEIFARIKPIFSPPSSSINVTMLNDTGSNMLTVFDTDLIALAIPPTYAGFGSYVSMSTAGGQVQRQHIVVEVQLLDSQGNPVSDWILEHGIVTPATLGTSRLSGDGMRQHLYFATAPGNTHLYVAEKKNGIVQQLPVV